MVKENGSDKSASQVKEIVIQTEGSNLLKVLGMPEVDSTRTVVNDLPEIYDVLGVEATRAMMCAEMAKTLPDAGLNPRHYPLLADVMMAQPSDGHMVGINRNGMRNTNTGVIAQASFEQPGDAFLNAGALGLFDNGSTVSTAVTLGTVMRQGTGAFSLLLDLNALPDLPDTPNDLRLVKPIVKTEIIDSSNMTVAQKALSNNLTEASIFQMNSNMASSQYSTSKVSLSSKGGSVISNISSGSTIQTSHN